MSQKKILGGVVHETPADLKQALLSNSKALETWENITPLARNEWICWIESAKKIGNQDKTNQMGMRKFGRGKKTPLLLGRMFTSLRFSRGSFKCRLKDALENFMDHVIGHKPKSDTWM